MVKTTIRRFIIFIPQIIALSLLTFFLANLMPGDVISQLAGPYADPEQILAMREAMGVDHPWYIQYVNWAIGVFTSFDFGRSFLHNQAVVDLIGTRVMNTVVLSFTTTIITIALTIPLGIIAAKFAGRWQDKLILNFGFASQAMPVFAMAIVVIWIFALILGWFPMSGSVSVLIMPDDTFNYIMSRLHHLILPSLVGGILGNFGLIFTLRAVILDNSSSAYVVTARSKGVPMKTIYNKHILRNSLLPFAGLIPGFVLGLLSGSVFIETIFGFPGMGQLFIQSIQSRDFPVVTALVMMYGIIALVGILLTDILITIIDPRIRIK